MTDRRRLSRGSIASSRARTDRSLFLGVDGAVAPLVDRNIPITMQIRFACGRFRRRNDSIVSTLSPFPLPGLRARRHEKRLAWNSDYQFSLRVMRDTYEYWEILYVCRSVFHHFPGLSRSQLTANNRRLSRGISVSCLSQVRSSTLRFPTWNHRSSRKFGRRSERERSD